MAPMFCPVCDSEMVVLHGRTETRKNLTWCSKCDTVYREGNLLIEQELDKPELPDENEEKPKRVSRPTKKSATK